MGEARQAVAAGVQVAEVREVPEQVVAEPDETGCPDAQDLEPIQFRESPGGVGQLQTRTNRIEA